MSTGAADTYQFHPVDIGCREPVERIRHRFGHTLSSHAFVSLYLWREVFGLSICIGRNAFFVRCRSKGENAFFFPCGDVQEILDFCRWLAEFPGASLHYLRAQDKEFLEQHFPGRFSFSETREDAEYIYRRAAQVQLAGGMFKNLRSKIHKAKDRYQWNVSPITPENLDTVRQITLRWSELRQDTADIFVVLDALAHYDTLGFEGILLENENGPQAAAFGSCIAEDTFDLHVTKTLLPSVDSYLKWELYSRLSPDIVWINQEEDLGLPGLRTNKTESVPEYIVPLWKGVLL